MYDLLARKGQMFAIVLGLLLIAIFLIPVITGLNSGGYGLGDISLKELSEEQKTEVLGYFSGVSITAYLVMFTAFLAFVFFGVVNLIKFPKKSIKAIIGFVGLLILFFILYKGSDAETTGKIGELVQRYNVSDNTSKLISGGLKTTLGLIGLSIIIPILFEIRNAFK